MSLTDRLHWPTRAVAFAMVLLLLPLAADAQRRDRPDRDRGVRAEEAGRGYFQVGYMGLDAGELNRSLTAAGFPALGEDFLTLGGGGMGRVGERFLLGGEGHGLLGESETAPGGEYRISAGGGYGLFRVGYEAWSSDAFDLIPMLGIGGGGLSVDITGRSAPTFGEVLEDPARSSSLSTGMFLLDAAVAASYRVRVRELERRGSEAGGLLFGIQAGYTYAPGGSSWDLDGLNSVAGGPDFQIEGFYVRASIGGWGMEPEDEERRRRRRR